jgi:hypothetical protein
MGWVVGVTPEFPIELEPRAICLHPPSSPQPAGVCFLAAFTRHESAAIWLRRIVASVPLKSTVPRLVNSTTPWRGGASSWMEIAMAKERCSAEQLADMITQKINVAGVEVAVRRDHAYGWVPTVVSAPSDQIGFQRRADEIAHVLRTRFELA